MSSLSVVRIPRRTRGMRFYQPQRSFPIPFVWRMRRICPPPERRGNNHVILLCKSVMEKQTLSSPYVVVDTLLAITFTPGPFRVQHPVPANMRNIFCGEEGHHTYSFVRQPTDKNRLRSRLLWCIYNCSSL